ncbi:hypothetical protein KIN20_018388 [Parelaphostrongylus tenuis]|uniref:Uncharacterized protein n=1 Tax=Parelaphostrongylus tenuis TaxID=148309 RepID=A0AAD5MJV7_PARTN|nr:hypothetical protein KIN20_018388 [Parelaphostrongylus tenuis]
MSNSRIHCECGTSRRKKAESTDGINEDEGAGIVTKATASIWLMRFKEGNLVLESMPHSGRLSVSEGDKFEELDDIEDPPHTDSSPNVAPIMGSFYQ